MLVSGIVVWSEVMRKNSPSAWLPIVINGLQLFIFIVLTVSNTILSFTADASFVKNYAWAWRFILNIVDAAKSWSPDVPLDPNVSKTVLDFQEQYQQSISNLYTQLIYGWISWFLTCSIPVAVFIILFYFLHYFTVITRTVVTDKLLFYLDHMHCFRTDTSGSGCTFEKYKEFVHNAAKCERRDCSTRTAPSKGHI